MQNNKRPAFVLNVWEQDYSREPLAAFIGQIESMISSHPARAKIEGVVSQLRKRANRLLRLVGRVAVEYATRGALRQVADESAADAATSMAGAIVQDELSRQTEIGNAVKNFKDTLAAFAKEVCQTDFPLVVVVDELDRCRPGYAIEFLESIKHVFNVERVVFVLSVDLEQLVSSLKMQLGPGLDSDGYLRRFVDYQIYLPQPELKQFCEELVHRLEIRNSNANPFGEIARDLAGLLGDLAQHLRFSLRRTEQLFTRFYVAYRMSEKPNWYYVSNATLFLLAVLEHDRDLYNELIAGNTRALTAIRSLPGRPGYDRLMSDRSTSVAVGQFMALVISGDLAQESFMTAEMSRAYKAVKGHHSFDDFPEMYLKAFRTLIELVG